jgi:hypothetical protein
MPVKKKEKAGGNPTRFLKSRFGVRELPEDEFAVGPMTLPSGGPRPAFEPGHKVAKEMHVCQSGNQDLARGIANESHGRIDELMRVTMRVFVIVRKGLGQVHREVVDRSSRFAHEWLQRVVGSETFGIDMAKLSSEQRPLDRKLSNLEIFPRISAPLICESQRRQAPRRPRSDR